MPFQRNIRTAFHQECCDANVRPQYSGGYHTKTVGSDRTLKIFFAGHQKEVWYRMTDLREAIQLQHQWIADPKVVRCLPCASVKRISCLIAYLLQAACVPVSWSQNIHPYLHSIVQHRRLYVYYAFAGCVQYFEIDIRTVIKKLFEIAACIVDLKRPSWSLTALPSRSSYKSLCHTLLPVNRGNGLPDHSSSTPVGS